LARRFTSFFAFFILLDTVIYGIAYDMNQHVIHQFHKISVDQFMGRFNYQIIDCFIFCHA
jgi:hypothetical protein